MKTIFSNIVFIFAVIASAAAALFGYMPMHEISIMTPDGRETVISWDITGAPAAADIHGITHGEKYFSIEKYTGGDVNDLFYIGIQHNEYSGAAGRYDWHIFRIEAYKNIDAAWINFEIGL